MQKIKYTIGLLIFFVSFTGCEEEDNFGFLEEVTAPTNVSAVYDITQDNTGVVTITPNGDGATTYNIYFGDGTAEPEKVKQGESITHTYPEGTYSVKIEAFGITGLKTEATQELVVSFKAPENLEVLIENDLAISKQVNVTATADFATMFDVYFGEDGNDDPITANIGEMASYVYQEPGTYTIRVVAKGAAIQTTEYTEEFEVTAILQPITPAPTPRARQEADVISIFSDAYTNVDGVDYFPDWGQGGQGSSWTTFDLNGDNMLQYINLSYQGVQLANPVDVSTMEYLHLDVWTADVAKLETSLISLTNGEKPVWTDLTADEWTSIDIPISAFTDQGLTVADIHQLKFVGDPWATGTVFIDNVYFYKESSTFNSGLLTNGDFEAGSDSWIVGVDDNTPITVVTEAGNTYYSANVTNAGNPWDVNMSQKLEIIQDQTYTLTFDAWSNVDRAIVTGIGLSGDPWSNTTEVVDITIVKKTYTLTLTAAGFGATDARVIFDLGAQVGEVNIDNVSLFLGNGSFDDGLLTNGDFEAGSDSWIVGVDDNTPITVVTEAGNTYYSANVTNAGNPWDVNMSQKLEIIQDQTYTLTFDAWSNVDREIVAGIGLSGDPWSSTTEVVDISTSRKTYTLTLTAAGFGATDARVIFDLGAQVGEVNIDNVSLTTN